MALMTVLTRILNPLHALWIISRPKKDNIASRSDKGHSLASGHQVRVNGVYAHKYAKIEIVSLQIMRWIASQIQRISSMWI